jgi:uncharacterized protein (DUF1330 family)
MQKYTWTRTVDGRLRKVKKQYLNEGVKLKDSLLDQEERRLNNIKRIKNTENFHKLFERIMKDKGIKVWKNGYPDYVVESKGKLTFVEVKNPKEKLKEHQREIRELFEKYGLKYFVYRGEEDMIKMILEEEEDIIIETM